MPGRRPRSLPPASAALAGLLAVAIACACQLAPGQTSKPVVPRLTREELLKKWDLNGDGKLDVGEVEVATSKMRLERAEMRLSTGLDPVTGKPRDPVADDLEGDADDDGVAGGQRKPLTVDELAEKLGFTPADADGEQAGTPRSPDPAATDAARTDRSAAIAPRPMFGLPPLRTRQAGALATPAEPSAPGSGSPGLPLTGGVRAGGLPARAGYGSQVSPPSLNAGRADAASTGGLLPRRRLPGAAPGLSSGQQSPAGSPSPTPSRPRRTVDDFDVYR